MIIGTSNNHYSEQRNILFNPENRYTNLKRRNIFYYINPFRQRLLGMNKQFVFMPAPFSMPHNVDVIHVFNEVAITSAKWIATFETELPRVLPVRGMSKQANPEMLGLVNYLLQPNCLGLIAISQATWHMQRKLLSHVPGARKTIESKTVVMHPPQPLYCQQRPLRQPGKIRFVFAGHEFYRKGGGEVILAFRQLLEAGEIQADQIEVLLVGDLSKRYNLAHKAHQDSENWHQEVEEALHSYPCFEHHYSLPNHELLQRFINADAGLLPTWHDTYGFSVLEMQACGCPVITSNVRALPEINSAQAGWMIEHPLNDDREYSVTTVTDKNRLRRATIAQLKQHILSILADPAQLAAKSAAAIARVREHHDPMRYALKLNEIYRSGIVASELTEDHQFPLQPQSAGSLPAQS